MDKATCKFYNGDYHNAECMAGVPYVSVTTEPDRIEGRAFRKPCIDWPEWHRAHGRTDFDNDIQRQNWEQRGNCDKRTVPTNEEIAEYEAESNAHIAAYLAALGEGKCPICHKEVKQRQVGACVYGTCGHRLYQGSVNPEFAEKATNG